MEYVVNATTDRNKVCRRVYWYAFNHNGTYYEFDIRGVNGFPLAEYMRIVIEYTHIKYFNFAYKWLNINEFDLLSLISSNQN